MNTVVLHTALPRAKALDTSSLREVMTLIDQAQYDRARTQIDSLLAADPTGVVAVWLLAARMAVGIETGDCSGSLGDAENALETMSMISGKRGADYHALLVTLIYQLSFAHHNLGDTARARKELLRAQSLLERLAKRDPERFSAMLLYAVEASTTLISNRRKQMEVFEHYQNTAELYAKQLTSGDRNATRTAMAGLVDTLEKEGQIMLDVGNSRNAVKYFTKALRYQKKLGGKPGKKELRLSIGLSKSLMRLVNRRASAEKLLQSLLPLARQLKAYDEVIVIENLLNQTGRNSSIMSLLKSL